MFARRPRFDDTFGVRMDLGADRMDPMSLRPKGTAGQLRVKPPVIVEYPGSVFGLFSRRSNDPFVAQPGAPLPAAQVRLPALPVREAPVVGAAQDEPAAADLQGGLPERWRRVPVTQRIIGAVFAFWLLLASGLLVPAILIAGTYFFLRRRKS